ncbi:chemotaxis protein [Cellvibrio zantedeschiae]|uniref:chemotaxis protein n=1 Tax=Cellvibrio zantedeschiae TaxID=1237077 RepID=UPI001674977D|nr:chemotaxis protein [Cellvibrio zantedeschiae]
MSKLLDSIDQRTRLVGENRLELLMFRLRGRQLFAINVFKVQEVVKLPMLRAVPHSHPHVKGVAHLRGQTVPVIDLSAAIGSGPLTDTENANLIVAEYNRSVQAFLIGAVDRIINLNWELILPPPKGTGRSHFLTAITRLDDQLVEILDVERVLADIIPYNTQVSEQVLDADLATEARKRKLKVLMADDSPTAVKQVQATLQNLGIEVLYVQDGLQALQQLQQWVREGRKIEDEIFMLITDAEMPEMDGYRLTAEVRKDPVLKNLYIVLHTSLSGSFNKAMVEKVGCDDFLSKFQPDELAKVVQKRLRQLISSQ